MRLPTSSTCITTGVRLLQVSRVSMNVTRSNKSLSIYRTLSSPHMSCQCNPPSSALVLINRRMDTPGVLVVPPVKGGSDSPRRVELVFRVNKRVDCCGENVEGVARPASTVVKVMQKSTGTCVHLGVDETFRFDLSGSDSLWVASSTDVVCWVLFPSR